MNNVQLDVLFSPGVTGSTVAKRIAWVDANGIRCLVERSLSQPIIDFFGAISTSHFPPDYLLPLHSLITHLYSTTSIVSLQSSL